MGSIIINMGNGDCTMIMEKLGIPHSDWKGYINDDYDTIRWTTDAKCTKDEWEAAKIELKTEYDTNQPLKLLREERDKKLKEEVDPKTCEAYNNGTQLSTEWKNYRQALLDMTRQTPTLDENGNLKAGLELDEIYWPTKPE